MTAAEGGRKGRNSRLEAEKPWDAVPDDVLRSIVFILSPYFLGLVGQNRGFPPDLERVFTL